MLVGDPAQRVSAGAALLDEVHPGWEANITLPTLDVGDFRACVLAQIFGSYQAGANELCFASFSLWDSEGLHNHGFTSIYENHAYTANDCIELGLAWKTLINARRRTP